MLRGGRSSKRRPLQTTALTSTGLDNEITNLQDKQHHYVEFDVKYFGVIPGVAGDTDTTNRTQVLKIIDRGKKQAKIPHQLTTDHDAILYLSTEVIKLNKREGNEEEICRLQLHEIAQVCYVLEDGQHILAVTHGTPEVLTMTVLLCDSKEQAEGICSIWSYCFHLVYNEAMVELIEETIDVVIDPSKSNTSGSTPTPSLTGFSPEPHPPPSDISNTSTQAELLKDYMWQLKNKLKVDELIQFSKQWKAWNYSTNKLQEFCDNLFKLFGPERTYLLTGLFPFIPERDCELFENFLRKHDIPLPGHGTVSSLHGFPTFYTRSISDISINSNTATSNDLDPDMNALDSDLLDAMGKKFEKIEHSVGDPTQPYFIYDRNSKV